MPRRPPLKDQILEDNAALTAALWIANHPVNILRHDVIVMCVEQKENDGETPWVRETFSTVPCSIAEFTVTFPVTPVSPMVPISPTEFVLSKPTVSAPDVRLGEPHILGSLK